MADLEIYNTTIAAGQTVSAPVGTGFKVIVGFSLPSNWTAANLTFRVSPDGVNFQNYVDGTQAAAPSVLIPAGATTAALQPNTFVYAPSGLFDGVNLLELVSSVAQANAVTIGVVVRTVAF